MPCVLWVSCDCSSRELIESLGLESYKTIEKGSTVATREGDKHFDHTLCGFDVSTGDFSDFKTLVKDSIDWLKANRERLEGLKALNATGRLDYGFYTQFTDSKIVAQYDTIPSELMKLAAALDLDIELSQYWYAEGQGAQLN